MPRMYPLYSSWLQMFLENLFSKCFSFDCSFHDKQSKIVKIVLSHIGSCRNHTMQENPIFINPQRYTQEIAREN